MGTDHLLAVFNSSYTEDYRRFYFRDIQAIVINRTPERAKWSAIYGGTALVLLLTAYFLGGHWGTFFIMLAAALVINLALNWLRGPTCACNIYTAASQTELPSLGRLKNALKTLEIIRPLIRQSQGSLSPEEIRTKIATSEGSGA
jgi:hypothetical protein